MKDQTWTNSYLDRSTWGSGLWDQEPDKVQWTDKATGLPCIVKRNHFGVWCGYVGVDRSHKYYSVHHNDIEVSVHGGLTYSGLCQGGPPEAAICHIPDPGEPDDVWWLGFDCGHGMDYSPGIMNHFPDLGFLRPVTYKTLEYTQRECTELAAQLKECE